MPADLFDYQLEAVRKLKNGSILCGGVGSGKSRTALAYYFVQNGGSLGDDGREITEDFDDTVMNDPPEDLYIITTARKRDTLEWEGELPFFLMSTDPEYNLYSNKIVVDSWNNIKKYVDVKGTFFIFDEQRVVGKGAWVKAFYKITKSNKWILLSATPGDTWSDYIPVFVANGFYKNRTEFLREHAIFNQNTKFPMIDRYVNTGRLLGLRNRILVDMDFRRTTVRHHEDIFCDYPADKYRSIYRTRWNPYEGRPVETAAELCFLLRKLVNTDDSRQKAMFEILEKHPKTIIFYNFNYELDLLKSLYFGEGTVIAEWNGQKHEPVPDGDRWIYLVQYNAGAEGWNCVSTDTVIFYSQNYSYRVTEQACGRIDRLNTPYHDLYYYHLKSRSNIDIAISRALAKKKNFNERKFCEF